MSDIRVTCPTCGDFTLEEEQITLRICRQTCDAEYRFRCPQCQKIQLKPCLPRVGELLVRYGVVMEWWDLPLLEPHDHHPPITLDDILEAHLELEQ